MSRDERRWLKRRLTGIGASEAASVAGLNKWDSPFSVYMRKTGQIGEQDQSEYMYWGSVLEPLIRARYKFITGRRVEYTGRYKMRFSQRWPFAFCTLDGVLKDPDRGVGVLEIKMTNAWSAKEWVKEPPLQYQMQVQHAMAVTGYAWGSIAVLIGGNTLQYFDLARDDDFIEIMMKTESIFWQRVIDRNPPDPDGSEASRRAILTLHPDAQGALPIVLNSNFTEIDADLQTVKAEIKELKVQEVEHSNRIRLALGDAEAGLIDGGIMYTNKNNKSGSRTLRRSEIAEG